ncbi:hypothetical protein, partial [Nocardia cyriacigeorgica]|uniref:hypothetical protein n=1 Tax=Nocardia cyriacigeorgica TaxID=135487 RepID=UPI001893EB63
ICGIQLSPEQWAEVSTVWEAGVRWLLRLTEVSEAELGDALAAEAEQLVGASYSSVTAHQRGKVYANAMSNWIEANRKQLAFKGHSPEQIETEINRLCDAEELSRIERRHRSYSRRW